MADIAITLQYQGRLNLKFSKRWKNVEVKSFEAPKNSQLETSDKNLIHYHIKVTRWLTANTQ